MKIKMKNILKTFLASLLAGIQGQYIIDKALSKYCPITHWHCLLRQSV